MLLHGPVKADTLHFVASSFSWLYCVVVCDVINWLTDVITLCQDLCDCYRMVLVTVTARHQ